jgi:molecular chaperone GrpE
MPKDDRGRAKRAGDKAQAISSQQEDQPTVQAEPAVTPREPEKVVDVEALQQELERQKERSEHNLEQWKRTAANLENYRKRVEKERAELLRSGQATLIAQLLPVLDDFERAFQTVPFALNSFTWTEGLALIDRKLSLILQQQGLEEINALGEPFDPALHHGLMEEETTAYADGHVMAVLQRGYMLHDKVLRPAIVKIARSKTSSDAGRTAVDSAEADKDASAQEQPTDEKSKNA